MALSAEQENALNQLRGHIPADAIAGYSFATTGEISPESPWVTKMQKFSSQLNENAYAYFNYNVRAKGGIKKIRRTPKKVISSEGFPPWITVTYAYPPPFSFYSMHNEREVSHFILHSFGHTWHASYGTKGDTKGKKIGWFNSRTAGKGVVAIEQNGQTIYIAKGSDPTTMAHFTRFSAGLRACLNSAAQASAHFFIDRAGNLVIIGDCNDVIFTTRGMNKVALGVEMEEAFYVTHDTRGKGNKVAWKSGGNPPGTAGDVEYFTYSIEQLLTLSILVKKLEIAYPQLRQRNVSFVRRSVTKDSPPGYSMHDYVMKNKHIDVSPHFREQALWDSFFALVDTHTHITSTNVFKPRQNYYDSGQSQLVEPLSSETLTAMTERVYNFAKERGVAYNRSANLAQTSKATINDSAGKGATKNALKTSQEVANTVRAAQQTQEPVTEYPTSDWAVDEDGLQVGSDDVW